ncbi:hypothetical protein [Rhizobacter sp. Root1221]|uniref:hypothetical protein n=1 Tax=Rhizobacter sp. Root1221 TaxID=1736433 RepID=UPI000714FB24|nr:hypothetical protein [Rhizobacter sp. Root1221]KQW01214.1 hypothetical protein ASC87_15090 [Rhizobacter sp. Root1221]
MNICRPLLLLLPLSLAGCLGSVDIGGTLSGLPSGASVTLQNNGGDNLTLTADGSFLFADPVGDGESYNVTVLTQPAGATCAVSGGTGTVAQDSSANITSVVVTCTATSSVSGTVLGLAAGVNLTLTTGTADLVVAANGAWAFPGTLASGTAYSVTVKAQPPGQTCTVANGSGTFTTGTATAVAVTCVP